MATVYFPNGDVFLYLGGDDLYSNLGVFFHLLGSSTHVHFLIGSLTMNPDVVDIGSSSFIPSEFVPVVPEVVSSGLDDINPNLDDSVDDEADQDEEFLEGQLFGDYYPDSEICKATHDPESWKDFTFRTFASFDEFFLNYAHDANFSVRKASTKTRRFPSDGVVREHYAT